MYKFIFRMRIGGKWLLVAHVPQRRGYFIARACLMRRYHGVFVIVRVWCLEVYLSELPF